MKTFELMPDLCLTTDRCVMVGNDTVIVADLHIGYESVLEEEGIHLPRVQTREISDRLLQIIDRYHPGRMVFLGDFKHEFSRNLDQEWSEVRYLLRMAVEFAEVILVRGNHDNYLATIASKMGIELLDDFCQAGITMAHGHVKREERPLLIAHEHPSVRIFDSVGAFVKLPCFLYARREQIIVLPAFSPLASGTDLSAVSRGGFLSPILNDLDLDAMDVFACSDIGLLPLGPLSSMRRE